MTDETTAAPFGPYETEGDTLGQPMNLELRRLHAANLIKSGDPDNLAGGTVFGYMSAACDTAGVTLGAFDRRTLAWLAGWEVSTAQVLIGLIYRAYASGVEAGRTAARTMPRPPWQAPDPNAAPHQPRHGGGPSDRGREDAARILDLAPRED